MTSLLGLQIVAIGFVIPHTLPRVNFNLVCHITLPASVNVLLGLISLVPPITTFLFILVKQLIGIREGWGTAPLMILLTRDSSWGVIGLVGVWVANPLVAISIGKPLAHVGHLWFMSIVPSIGCRVILNMQRFKVPRESGDTDGVQLTTGVPSYQMTSLESLGVNSSLRKGAAETQTAITGHIGDV